MVASMITNPAEAQALPHEGASGFASSTSGVYTCVEQS